MESFFVTLASTSLIVSWFTAPHLQAMKLPKPCDAHTRYEVIAEQNADTIKTAEIAPFGRKETGWQVYAPQVAETISTTCAPDTKRFAANLSLWQSRNRLRPTGALDETTLVAMKASWQKARPFIAAFSSGDGCPDPAPDDKLVDIGLREGWQGKRTKLHRDALANLRKMVAAARAAEPRIARDKQMLTIVSAFRSPEYDMAACVSQNCNGIAKAKCSAHRTGTAIDLYVGAAPGQSPVSSANDNRLFQTRTPAYRWLVQNAAKYGFVNYVFEPWHWEWVGPQKPMPTPKPQKRLLFAEFLRKFWN